MPRPHRPLFLLALLLLSAALLVACGREKSAAEEGNAAQDEAPFELSVDQKGTLYTWVAADGSFHLAEKLADIPPESQSAVRVVVEGAPPGSPTHVYVADLRGKKPGDSAPVSALSRETWEAKGRAYRDAQVKPLEEKEKAAASDTPLPAGVGAIVYGADWCKPCHQAEDYLKKKGISVVKKDIEEDPKAAAEMRQKMQRAGLGTSSSIPILDVAGTMLVGFSPKAIDAALKRAVR